MGVRVLLIASISTGLVLAGGTIYAQDTPAERTPAQGTSGNVQALPPVEITAPETGTKRGQSRTATRVTPPRTRLYVPVSAPLPGPTKGTDVDKVPSGVSFIDTREIARTDSLNVTDALEKYVPSVDISEVTGNPFNPTVQYRGFVASPVDGTPQGLAVYQNGVRINEAFGDTVNWGLIPTTAIRSISVVPNNPAFGLNALGGAINLQMKDGFNYHGAEINTMGGSYGRIQGSAQWGKQVDSYAVYGALEGVHDNGFRNFSPTDIRRFYSDVGYSKDGNEFHLNMGLADNKFGAATTVPIELLNQFWGATYTTPQTTNNQVGYVNLTGKVEATPTWTIDGVAHLRFFNQKTVDGNPTGTQACADPTLLCFGNDMTPAFGLNGVQLANPFAPDAVLGENDRTTTRSTTAGLSVQATNTDQLFGHDNRFVVGASYDASVTNFNATAELGTIGSNFVVTGSGIFLGQSGDPISIGPVSLRTTNQYTGIYALDTFDVTNAFSITGGGRFNDARIELQDLIGTALNGNHTFDRFNPVIGGTYKITPELTAYASYSEANRAPTPLELGCADPARPCLIAAFLVADPSLQQVVSHTVEAGLRGTKELSIGTLSWKFGAYRTRNDDDILNLPSPQLQGFGFFQNIGSTRRQGFEAEVNIKSSALQLYASYALVDARFLNPLQLASNSPFANPDTGLVQVLPGNVIPGIPRNRVKAGFDYSITDKLKVGGDALFVGSQYFVGDDNNQAPKLPAYAVFNVHASYQVDKNIQLYGRVDNLFDNRYATYGTFFDTNAIPNLATGGAFTDARSLSPARPRAFYAGLKATF